MIPSYTIAPFVLVIPACLISVEEELISLRHRYISMADGGWEHEYGGEQTDYEEYELSPQEQASLQRIIDVCKDGYEQQQAVREHINYLEHLSKRIADILRSEESFGYSNVTLKHDYRKVQRTLERLEQELKRLDPEDF